MQDLFVTSRGAGRLEWLAGVYGSATETHTPTELLARLSFSPDVMVYSDDRHDRIEEIAAYGEVAYRFSSGWTAAVGGRVFGHRTHTRSEVVSERSAPRSLNREMDFTGFSPKVSVQREFGSGDLVYAVVTEGHRAGGVNSGGANPLDPALVDYVPDRMRNHEAGVKLTAWDDRLALNAAAFYAIWKDIQTDQYRRSGIPFTTNAGDADIYGLETELAFRWTEALTVQLNGRASHAETKNPNPNFAQELADELPGAPTISGAALVTYERPLRGGWNLRLLGETSYVGRSRLTWDHTPAPKMGGYVRTRLIAELNRRNLGVQVFVTNPTDAFSDTYAFGNPFNPDRVQQITPQRPRTVGITLYASY